MSSTVILANGSFPQATVPRKILQNAQRIICCDGAAATLLKANLVPTAVVGDLDSLDPKLKIQLQDKVVHIPEQETNDLSKAFRFCIQKKWTDNIVILGATGKREDHTLGNISLLVDFAKTSPDIKMVTDDGCFQVLLKSSTVDAIPGQQISIFAMVPDTPIQSTNLKYPLNGLIPTAWWQATLNEATDTSFTLTFPDNHPILIFKANCL